jgi:lysophospholipase L1-like esterase
MLLRRNSLFQHNRPKADIAAQFTTSDCWMSYAANAWTPMREMHRAAVNAWIRESGSVDDCGDGLHPSDCGYYNMGDRARAGPTHAGPERIASNP